MQLSDPLARDMTRQHAPKLDRAGLFVTFLETPPYPNPLGKGLHLALILVSEARYGLLSNPVRARLDHLWIYAKCHCIHTVWHPNLVLYGVHLCLCHIISIKTPVNQHEPTHPAAPSTTQQHHHSTTHQWFTQPVGCCSQQLAACSSSNSAAVPSPGGWSWLSVHPAETKGLHHVSSDYSLKCACIQKQLDFLIL